MSSLDFLLWVRGPGFELAVVVFLLGVVFRIMQILMMGRAENLAVPKGDERRSGMRTILTRSWPVEGMFKRSPTTYIAGYAFHLGLFVTILLFVPHIELIRAVFGIGWPGLPTPMVDAVTVVTMVSLIVLLISRLGHPVRRFLSTRSDYLDWTLTFLPVLTGYMAFHHMLLPYTTMLAIHIATVELLMVVIPFTKLSHTFTLFIARWYNGAMAGRKGVQV